MPEDIKLQKHQTSAVNQLNKSRSLIAYHGLGSGKTLTAIEAGRKTPGSKLVLTPASLQHNFRKELHKFNVPDDDFHAVSYEKFRRDPNYYIEKYKPKMIIADEFHRAQNEDSLIGQTLRNSRLKVDRFLGLTGSLAQNHPSEIGELLHTATGRPVLGKNVKEFRDAFIKERVVKPGIIGRIMGRQPGIIEEPKNLDKFKQITDKYINTFSGDEEYVKHIPKVEKSIVHISMDKPQQKIYDYTFGKAPAWVKFKIRNNLPPSKREAMNINAFLIGARQASTATEPFGGHSSTPKINAVIHDLEHGIKHDKNFKGVVYSSFLDGGLNPLSERLKKSGIAYGSFTGQQTNAERNEMIKDYNHGKLKALLISPAGVEGLDLKGTKYMGLMDPSWNPEKINQAIGRTARYKSHEMLPENERKVIVKQYLSEPKLGLLGKIKKIFKPETHAIGVDEYIYNRAMEKQSLNEKFTNALQGKRLEKTSEHKLTNRRSSIRTNKFI
jgi:superfamily II DNA or RNA helicase